MDSQGFFVPAGFDAPSVAPSVTTGATGAGLTANKWVAYSYVYAAEGRYPLVQNARQPGGSSAPRSNPSEVVGKQTHATLLSAQIVEVTRSTRVDVTEIWIYRTDYFDTEQEAEDAGNAGLAYYIGSVVNPGLGLTTTYTDTTTTATGGTQIEYDNFPAPIFKLCIWAEPYFLGFGNAPFEEEVEVTAAGVITLTDPDQKWFSGRDGQQVTMEGINTGGYDGYGGFYFKAVTNTTGQLYLDIDLTQAATVNKTGTTQIRIKGASNLLFISKPNNPFSWGSTKVVGGAQIPELNFVRVGGGEGTSIAVIPALSLVKVDCENPSASYSFDLRQVGTTAFAASRNDVSRTYSVSNPETQFEIPLQDGNTVTWGLDGKNYAIVQSDGLNQAPISTNIFATLRNISTDPDDRKFNHGIYDPRTEIAIFWFTDKNYRQPGYGVVYHVPTGNWFLTEDMDVACSALVLDNEPNVYKTLIGTESGLICEAFSPGIFGHHSNLITGRTSWWNSGGGFTLTLIDDATQGQLDTAQEHLIVGNWITLFFGTSADPNVSDQVNNLGFAAVAKITGMTATQLSLDPTLAFGQELFENGSNFFGIIGHIPIRLRKTFNASNPSKQKQITDIALTIAGIDNINESPINRLSDAVVPFTISPQYGLQATIFPDYLPYPYPATNPWQQNEAGQISFTQASGRYTRFNATETYKKVDFAGQYTLELTIVGLGFQPALDYEPDEYELQPVRFNDYTLIFNVT